MRPTHTIVIATILALSAAACAPTRYIAVPTPAVPAAPALQACATHAAAAQRATFGSAFHMLQFRYEGLAVSTPLTQYVGRQPVGSVYDGQGTWFGRPDGTCGEWRQIRFHCLVSPSGKVLYSYVRPE